MPDGLNFIWTPKAGIEILGLGYIIVTVPPAATLQTLIMI